MLEDEGVRRIIKGHFKVWKRFRELEFGAIIEKAANTRMKSVEDMVVEKDDSAFIKPIMKKLSLVPQRLLMLIRTGYG